MIRIIRKKTVACPRRDKIDNEKGNGKWYPVHVDYY